MSNTIVSSGCPRSTPWGQAQGTPQQLCRGVYFVSTSSHGGVYVTHERRAEIPACLSAPPRYASGGWYEEDCEWAIPFLVFWQEIQQGASRSASKLTFEDVSATVRNWYPAKYEAYFHVTLKPGESRVRDQENFYKDHAADWIVTAAWGDWHARVPKGMVGVVAEIAGGRTPDHTRKYFLVPKEEYKQPFVIDQNRHEEIAPIQ